MSCFLNSDNQVPIDSEGQPNSITKLAKMQMRHAKGNESGHGATYIRIGVKNTQAQRAARIV